MQRKASARIRNNVPSSWCAVLLTQLLLLSQLSPTAAFTPEAITQISNLASNAISSGSFLDLTPYGLANWAINSNLYAWLQQALVEVFNMDESTLTSLSATFLSSSSSSSGSNLATAAKVAAVAGGLAGGLAGGVAGGKVAAAAAAAAMGPGGLPLPPPLPALPPKHPLAPWSTAHEKALHVLADKWTGALVKAQFNPGLQTMLKITGLDQLQEALIKWVCILYPWKGPVADALIPEALSTLRDAYCTKALPAAAVAKIMPPKPPLLGPQPPLLGGPLGVLGLTLKINPRS